MSRSVSIKSEVRVETSRTMKKIEWEGTFKQSQHNIIEHIQKRKHRKKKKTPTYISEVGTHGRRYEPTGITPEVYQLG